MNELSEWYVSCTSEIYRTVWDGDNGLRLFKLVGLNDYHNAGDFSVIEVGV